MAQPRQRFLVLGLGVLGEALACTLASEGADVIAVDLAEPVVNRVKDYVALAAVADVTDIKALEQLGARDVDVAVVAVGEDLEAGVVATANLLDLGVRYVASRANTKTAETILKRLGAHEVFFVETTVGQLMGRRLYKSTSFREMDLGGGLSVVQWEPPARFHGKTLVELALPRRYGAQVIGLRKIGDPEGTLVTPRAETVVEPGSLVLLAGKTALLEELLKLRGS